MIRVILWLISSLAFVLFLNNPAHFRVNLPPLGNLLSPFTGFWQNAENVNQYANFRLTAAGLNQEVSVVFDREYVPHIFANNASDAFFVQGYVSAMLRLWQMDIATRAASGRLSEVLGERTLPQDIAQRKKQIHKAAKKTVQLWSKNPEELSYIQAYTDGINAYIQNLRPRKYPLEFKLLGYKPELWTVEKSALFFKSMAETLSFQHDDLPATFTLGQLGESMFNDLFPDWNPRQVPIIPDKDNYPYTDVARNETMEPGEVSFGETFTGLLPQPPPNNGSNNWALSGKKTSSGYPILANDPHLSMTLPAIWYEVQIHCPDFNAYGVTFPGIPGILIGFNEQAAWGVTNVGHDVLDWYRIKWEDDQKKKYLLDNEWKEVIQEEEAIFIKGKKEPYIETVKITEWGPIVYPDLAMKWLAIDTPDDRPFSEIGTFVKMMKAKNYADYREALQGFANPAQNFVFASVTDEIGLTVTGKLPIKKRNQGKWINDGTSSFNDWNGYIPFEHLPFSYNPTSGYVSSANQHSTYPEYPYYYNGGFDDYRGRILHRFLDQKNDWTVEDVQKLQNNNRSILAEEALPALLGMLDFHSLNDAEKEIVDWLQNWNYEFDADQYAPTYFLNWFDEAYQMTFDEFKKNDNIDWLMPELWRFIQLINSETNHPIFDIKTTPGIETATEIINQSWRQLMDKIPNPIRWSDHKQTYIPHLTRIESLGSAPIEIGGYVNALNSIKRTHGPSWRMVVELGPEIKGYGIYPGGQSGNPGSLYYDDRIDDWSKGKYHPLILYKDFEDANGNALFTIEFKKHD
jgi:penicillin G amidase